MDSPIPYSLAVYATRIVGTALQGFCRPSRCKKDLIETVKYSAYPIAIALLVSACGGSGGNTSEDSITDIQSANGSMLVEETAVDETVPPVSGSIETEADDLSEPVPVNDAADVDSPVNENADSVPQAVATPEIESGDATPVNGLESAQPDGQVIQEQATEQPEEPRPDNIINPQPVLNLVAAAAPPNIDANSQVTWPFAPIASSLNLEIMPFVEMPLSNEGRPARWNDMEFVAGRLFVSDERDGLIYEISERQPELWFDVANALSSNSGLHLNIESLFHGGVRGFAFHPDFSANGKFYVSLMQDRPVSTANHRYLSDAAAINADSVLLEWTANPQTFEVDPASYRELFRVGIPEFDHPIKQIAFNPTALVGDDDYGLLYVAHGDGSVASSTTGDGRRNDALGKILRINPLQSGDAAYSVPASNPFVGDPNMLDEVFSIGHRNPHHLAFLPDGSLLATEAGRDNIDEINRVFAGSDYGWSEREGAYIHRDQGTLVNGISVLPEIEDNNYVYPVMQFGHTGPVGGTFLAQALGGGFPIDNGSALSGNFFYVEFVLSGRLFHSSFNDIVAANTTGNRDELTLAQTFEASVLFDHDGDLSTESLPMSIPEVLQTAVGYDNSGRADIRIGQGPRGEMYLMNKRNNVIYLVRNSWPAGTNIPASPDAQSALLEPVNLADTRPPVLNEIPHGAEIRSRLTAEAQAQLPADCLLASSGEPSTSPVYCFSPQDRRLMRVASNGLVVWQFNLPGNNAGNHIESIDFINGFMLAVLVDATPSFDDSAYDMNLFFQTGEYIGTVHIIPDIENPDGVDFAGVNLEGRNIIVRPGPIRLNLAPADDSQQERYTNDLFIYGQHYSEIDGADTRFFSGWQFEGAFRARVDGRTGETLDTLLFPGAQAAEILDVCPVPQSVDGLVNGGC